jgi:hypothetical protein
MKDIFPEVKAYWESLGYQVKIRLPGLELPGWGSMSYDIVKDNFIVRTIALVFEEENRKTVYYLGSQAFYGDDILKVLKLKAFL